MYKKLENEIKQARLNREKRDLSALSVFKNEILVFCKENKIDIVSDTVVQDIADKVKKEMTKSLSLFESEANRDLLNVVERYAPNKVTPDEASAWVSSLPMDVTLKEIMIMAKEKFNIRFDGMVIKNAAQSRN